jgi:RNA polymerase sigma-70 factor, ECF subfamily
MATDGDDSSLISRAVQGDGTAIQKVLIGHRKPVTEFIRKRFPEALRTMAEPDDLIQEVWIRAIDGFGEFRGDSKETVYHWLVVIARTVMVDQLKRFRAAKRKGTGHLLRDILGEEPTENSSIMVLLREMALYQRTPSKSASGHELVAALHGAVGRLPTDQAEAIRLRYFVDLDVREIANRMRRTSYSVKNLLYRGLKTLREDMKSGSL